MFPRLKIAPEFIALMTRPFVAATLLLGPVLGSAVSALVVMAALLGLFQYINNDYSMTKSRPLWLIYGGILIWLAAAALVGLAHYQDVATWRAIAQKLPYLGFIVFVSRLVLIDKPDLRRTIHLVSPPAAFLTLALAVAQVQFVSNRAEGMAGNSGPFGVLCLIQFSFCLLTAVETEGRSRVFGIGGAAAAAASVALSGMRGLWPCLVLVPAALAILHRDALRSLPKRTALAGALVFLAAFAAVSEPMLQRIHRLGAELATTQTGGIKVTSLSQHLAIWQAGWTLLLDAPLTGHGIGRNRQLIAEKTRELGREEAGFSHFHNAILTQGVQTGVIGIAALIAMFFAPLVLALRSKSGESQRHGLSVILCASLIYGVSGATGVMFGHDLMDAVWIAAISYGSYMVFGAEKPEAAHTADQAANAPSSGTSIS